MRGNSGFLRWAIIGFSLVFSVAGGPPRPRRMIRETYSSYSQESVPMSLNTTEDTDMCTQNGKEILRSSVTCEKKNGCREIETHGECCPKFLCECKLNGTVYENGDKIVDPENPCEVCVCRGGDINCNALQCYTRNDCKNVTYTPGVCCPEYMNCPPLENVELNSSNETMVNEGLINDMSSTISTMSFSEDLSTSTFSPTETSTQTNDNPIGIKIKEITKPEEIRITDDRPKVFKPTKSSEIVSTKSDPSAHSVETHIEPEICKEAALEILSEEISQIQSEIEPEIQQHTTFTFDGSADQPIQLESTDLNTVGDVSMGPKIVRQTDNGLSNDHTIAPFSSENEIKDDILTTKPIHVTVAPFETNSVVHNTSVLQVGDSVVIFDRSGQTQSIPLRVVGLQRGEDTYDEDDERKEGRKSDSMESSTAGFAESVSVDQVYDETTPFTQVYETFYYEPAEPTDLSIDFSSSEANKASYDSFADGLQLNGNFKEQSTGSEELNAAASSEKSLDIDDSSGFSSIDSFMDKITAPSNVYHTIINIRDDFEGSTSTSDEISTDADDFVSSSSPSYSSSSESTTEDDEMLQHDQNINFPHITDDLSIHGSRMEEDDKLRVNSRVINDESDKSEIETATPNNPILPVVGLINGTSKRNNEFNDVEARSPGEPLLIPEWERNHTTIAPFEFLNSNETTGVEELSSHSIESAGDDDSTSHHTDSSSNADIVETSSSTSSYDPNYDIESIEDDHTSGPSQVKETNNFNLFLDGTADFFRIQKKIWNSAIP